MHFPPMLEDDIDAMGYSAAKRSETFLANLSADYPGEMPSDGTLDKMLQEVLSTARKR